MISSTSIMKLVIVLLLVGIVTVNCLPKRGGGRGRGGRGKSKPCEGWSNVESCLCTDESTCDSKDDCKANCGKRSDNPIVSCTCTDGESWTKPEKGGRLENKDRPCGKRRNVESCVCADGETYEGRAVKRNCKKDDNPAEACTCKDGSEWPSEEEDSEEEDSEEEDSEEDED